MPLTNPYLLYLDFVREWGGNEKTLAPKAFGEIGPNSAEVEIGRGPPSLTSTSAVNEPLLEKESPEIPLDSLAHDLPDPTRPFWWFSTTPLPNRRISAGCPEHETAGSRLPLEADYWCHEGDEQWTKVDRAARPKPEMKKRPKAQKR